MTRHARPTPREAQLPLDEALVRAFLRQGPRTQRELVDGTGLPRPRVLYLLRTMVGVTREGESHRARYYLHNEAPLAAVIPLSRLRRGARGERRSECLEYADCLRQWLRATWSTNEREMACHCPPACADYRPPTRDERIALAAVGAGGASPLAAAQEWGGGGGGGGG